MDNIYRVFFYPENSIWTSLFADTLKSQKYECCSFYDKCKTRISSLFLYRKIHKFTPHFIKRLFFRYVLKYDFLYLPRKKNIFFAFTNGFEMCAENVFPLFIDFLKKEFPNAKFGIHYYEALQHRDKAELMKINSKFDCVFTFNKYDAENLNISYYGPVCEKHTINQNYKKTIDLFYSGGCSVSERFNEVLNIFVECSKKGLICEFFMHGLTDERIERLHLTLGQENDFKDSGIVMYYKSKFHYNQYQSYQSNLKWMLQSNVVLEIVTESVLASCSCRLAQCMNYDIKLLTNCFREREENFFCQNNISFFKNASDIDLSFFALPYEKVECDMTSFTMLRKMEEIAYSN